MKVRVEPLGDSPYVAIQHVQLTPIGNGWLVTIATDEKWPSVSHTGQFGPGDEVAIGWQFCRPDVETGDVTVYLEAETPAEQHLLRNCLIGTVSERYGLAATILPHPTSAEEEATQVLYEEEPAHANEETLQS